MDEGAEREVMVAIMSKEKRAEWIGENVHKEFVSGYKFALRDLFWELFDGEFINTDMG